MTGRPLPCEEARALLDEGLDRALDPAEEAALAAHLRGCAACRSEAAALAAVDGALRGMEGAELGPSFSDGVIAALDRAPGGAPGSPPAPLRVRVLRAVVAAGGTAAVVALAMAVLPVEAAASTVATMVPSLPAPPIPEVLAGFSGIGALLPAWAAAAGSVLAAAAAGWAARRP